MLEELRETRERTHSLYCLPLDMWLEWLADEETLNEGGDPLPVIALYDRAVKLDYRYFKVCRRYVKYVLHQHKHNPAIVNEQIVRDMFDHILQIYGLEVNRSAKFW